MINGDEEDATNLSYKKVKQPNKSGLSSLSDSAKAVSSSLLTYLVSPIHHHSGNHYRLCPPRAESGTASIRSSVYLNTEDSLSADDKRNLNQDFHLHPDYNQPVENGSKNQFKYSLDAKSSRSRLFGNVKLLRKLDRNSFVCRDYETGEPVVVKETQLEKENEEEKAASSQQVVAFEPFDSVDQVSVQEPPETALKVASQGFDNKSLISSKCNYYKSLKSSYSETSLVLNVNKSYTQVIRNRKRTVAATNLTPSEHSSYRISKMKKLCKSLSNFNKISVDTDDDECAVAAVGHKSARDRIHDMETSYDHGHEDEYDLCNQTTHSNILEYSNDNFLTSAAMCRRSSSSFSLMNENEERARNEFEAEMKETLDYSLKEDVNFACSSNDNLNAIYATGRSVDGEKSSQGESFLSKNFGENVSALNISPTVSNHSPQSESSQCSRKMRAGRRKVAGVNGAISPDYYLYDNNNEFYEDYEEDDYFNEFHMERSFNLTVPSTESSKHEQISAKKVISSSPAATQSKASISVTKSSSSLTKPSKIKPSKSLVSILSLSNATNFMPNTSINGTTNTVSNKRTITNLLSQIRHFKQRPVLGTAQLIQLISSPHIGQLILTLFESFRNQHGRTLRSKLDDQLDKGA